LNTKISRLRRENSLLGDILDLLPQRASARRQKQKDRLTDIESRIKGKKDDLRAVNEQGTPKPAAVSAEVKPVSVSRPNIEPATEPMPDSQIQPLLDQLNDFDKQIRKLLEHIRQLNSREESLQDQLDAITPKNGGT
jgi:chromosome segregation ATPase